MSENILKKIPYNSRPKVLLLGNGLNRAYGTSTWKDIITSISCDDYEELNSKGLENLPYPLQAVIYTHDNVDEGVDMIADHFMKESVSDDLAIQLRELACMEFDAILTTNYTYDIEKALIPDFVCQKGRASKYRHSSLKGNSKEEQFGIYKYMHIETPTNNSNVWHIHGEAARTNSMVLGHYYYGNMVSTIQQHISRLMAKYRGCNTNKVDFQPLSWIDYFMVGDIYILGLGLDPSEFDMWWLINCKKRHKSETNSGKIYWFEPNLDTREYAYKKLLAKDNDIEVITEKIGKKEYREYYKRAIQSIKTKMHEED